MNPKNSKKQAAPPKSPQPRYDEIYLGVDLHKGPIILTRIIDNSSPQSPVRLDWDSLYDYLARQQLLGRKVYVAYEAGAFGFAPCRKMQAMGLTCYVVKPKKLDPHNKRVQTDRTDSRELADGLVRFVRGNDRAMTPIYVPTVEEEQKRIEARHRRTLRKQMHRAMSRGRGLLLSQSIKAPSAWWTPRAWEKISPQLSPQLHSALTDDRALIEDQHQRLRKVEKKLKAAAPKTLPLGFGELTYVLLARELCNFARFKNRRGVGGFTGLCGGVSASGPYHLDLSISKAGSAELRALVIELAWRMIYYQPDYPAVRRWNKQCAGGQAHARRRKVAIVALARQLLVDIWRWQTGRVTPEQLGWVMKAAA